MNGTTRLYARVPTELKTALLGYSDRTGVDMSIVIRDALGEYLDRHGQTAERVQLLPRFGREDGTDDDE